MLFQIVAITLFMIANPGSAGSEKILDKPTGATVTVPRGYAVVANEGGVPEWHLAAGSDNLSAPPLGTNKSVLCAVAFSGTPAVGGHTDAAYLKEEVDDHMRSLGARDRPSVFEPTPLRFLMVSEWNPREGDDEGNTVFMYHAESNRVYAYMSCTTQRDAANAARPLFRAFWDGITLPN